MGKASRRKLHARAKASEAMTKNPFITRRDLTDRATRLDIEFYQDAKDALLKALVD